MSITARHFARLARRSAVAATKDFKRDTGHALTAERLDAMTMVEISDRCRDSVWDILDEEGLDFDEHGMDLTDWTENVLMKMVSG
jgi:hypothetical protein